MWETVSTRGFKGRAVVVFRPGNESTIISDEMPFSFLLRGYIRHITAGPLTKKNNL